jgi:hypothetical protein
MANRFLIPLSAAMALALMLGNAAGQTPAPASAKNWTPPRTADGKPDLQGIWTNATLTPLQRPAELGTKEFFTNEEAAAFEKQRVAQNDVDRIEGQRGASDLARRAYNNVWFDRGTHGVKTRRTSLIVDPPDGRVPAMTAAAQKRYERIQAEDAAHPSDGPENRLLTERCILFGAAGPPMLPEPYNNNYQIVQSLGYVAILVEMNHQVRLIPTDGRPHSPPEILQWIGDSRGHWEGDTLVVDTIHFVFNDKSRFGVGYLNGMTDDNLHVVERFTRTDADTIMYRATIDDPTVYIKPWTVEISMTARKEPLYEYACNEGNYGMVGILAGARADERKGR